MHLPEIGAVSNYWLLKAKLRVKRIQWRSYRDKKGFDFRLQKLEYLTYRNGRPLFENRK
jgi:hypothetical protein